MKWVTDPMGQLKKMFDNTLAPFLEALAHLRNGDFMEAAKALGRGVLGLNPIGMMKNAGMYDGLGDAFSEGYDAGVNKFAEDGSSTEGSTTDPTSAGTFDTSVFDGIGAGGKGKGGLGSGLSEVRASAPKTFNITINKMAGIENLNTTNIKGALGTLEQEVKRILLNALNDAQALST
jgi:hypothetical protein